MKPHIIRHNDTHKGDDVKKSCMDKNQFAKRLQEQKSKYYRMAYSYVKNEHDALDIIGEASYKGLKELHTLKQPEYFDTWMTRIVINAAIDYIRKNTSFVYCEEDTIGVMKVTESGCVCVFRKIKRIVRRPHRNK